MRARAVRKNGQLIDVHLSGDFFFPAASLVDLEQALVQVPAEAGAITQTVERFYEAHGVQSPGLQPKDFAALLAG